MFWVLGGVSKILDKVDMYKTFFSEIKNVKTLWSKSMLVFDKDRLTDAHLAILQKALKDKKKLPNFALPLYTQETVLLTDLRLLAVLLSNSFEEVKAKTLGEVERVLQSAVLNQEPVIRGRYDNAQVENNFVQNYKGSYLKKFETVFDERITINDIDLLEQLRNYYAATPAVNLASKKDVVEIINHAFASLGLALSVDESVFYTLVQHSNSSTMYPQWNALVNFLEG